MNRIRVISRKELTLDGVTHFEKDKIYFLEDMNETITIVSDETEKLCFRINNELLDEYFIGQAEYRDIQINSILE